MKIHPLQAMVDGMSAEWQKDRAKSQMTLGELISKLEQLDGNREIAGIGKPDSYRGYYSDLAFEPIEEKTTIEALLKVCRYCMGIEFTGYKGGEYLMGESTPLWIASYGVSGDRLMELNDSEDVIVPITEPEPPDDQG